MPIRRKRRQIFIEPPHLTWQSIRGEAEKFRIKYVNPFDTLPVPIIHIAEISLGLKVIPKVGILEEIDIDGFLTNDLSAICIDQDIYMDERRVNRLRFTYAHEIGHLILHKNEIRQCTFRTPEDWIYFHQDFSKTDLGWFESQAREFGGRLLVPRQVLISEILEYRHEINEFRSLAGDEEDLLIEAIAGLVCGKFGVSDLVIQKRIRVENIWGEIVAAL